MSHRLEDIDYDTLRKISQIYKDSGDPELLFEAWGIDMVLRKMNR